MFVEKTALILPTNATNMDSNIALHFAKDVDAMADTIAVIHENHINLVPVTNVSRRSKYIPIFKGEEKSLIKQIRWVEIGHKIVFVIMSSKGLIIYNDEVTDVIFQHGCRETGDEASYTIGVCVLRNNILCVGTHLGTVWMFTPNDDSSNFKVLNRVYAHDEAVLLLEGLGSFMVSSSDTMTYMWTFNDQDFDIIRKLEVPGMSMTSPNVLKFKFGLIIIGYLSGEFCLFDMNDEDFCIRTVGHKLKITGLDFSASFNILTTCIDGYVKVWKYEQINNRVNLLQAILNEDGPLCGVAFLNYSSTELCAVTADHTKVKVFVDWDSDIDIEIIP